MKNLLIICTHGDFGKEIIHSAEMIIGKTENVKYFSLKEGMDPFQYRSLMTEYLDEHEDCGVLCLVDLFGGTPCNMATSIPRDNYEIVSGLNLAMLIETYSLLQSLTVTVEQLKMTALDTLSNSGHDVKKRFQELKLRKR